MSEPREPIPEPSAPERPSPRIVLNGRSRRKAVLLAAGLGTRLLPLTRTTPKILVRLNGESLLEHQIRYLAKHGVTDVAVNAHHLAALVEAAVPRLVPRIHVTVSVERRLLGTAGALLPLRELLTERFIVLYGDVLTNADLCALLDAHVSCGGLATIAWYRSNDARDKGVLRLDRDGRVTHFVEGASVVGSTSAVNAGLYVLEPDVVDLVQEGDDFGLDVWPRALRLGYPVYAYRIDGYVRDVGHHDALRHAREEIRAGAIRW